MKRFLMRWFWILNLVFFVAMAAWTANNLVFGPWQAAISPAIVAGVNAYAVFLWWQGFKQSR